MGFFTPGPFLGHLHLGNGFDASPNLGFAQRMRAMPGGVVWATHVANLVNPVLERGNPAADKSPQEVICHQPFSLERDDILVD